MKNLFTILTAIFLTANIFAQSPEKLNYQAVIRDSNGHVITNQAIGMQISILQGGATGTAVYTETQLIISNANGLIKTEIGTGTVMFGDFSTIDWGNGPYFLKIETDPNGGTSYVITGTNQLLSVPYAMFAKTADSLTDIDNFSWSTTGNAGTDLATNFIGTTDNNSLIFKVDNIQAGKISVAGGSNTFYGYAAGMSNQGIKNTALGHHALSYTNTGHGNTAMGYHTLNANTTGSGNVAIGMHTLSKNNTGSANIAIGEWVLNDNVNGSYNTATGTGALKDNLSSFNTANGYQALYSNTTGVVNTAAGYEALYNNINGNHNTANGNKALYGNTSGQRNTATGSAALNKNETGNDNTAIGFTALYENLEGDDNTAIGRTALFSNLGDENTAIGRSALYYNTSGNQNTAVGRNALVNNTNGSNNTGIGYNAQVPTATASDQVRIGNTDISYAGIQVSWSITSDKIWKEQIRELPYGLDMLMQLKPVDYYRKNNEVKKREMGFVAQDVEATLKEMAYVDQGFLTKDDEGHISLRYNDFIALLTKALQEQQEIIEQLNNENEQQSTELKTQTNNYEKLLKRIEQLEKSNIQ